MKKRLLITSIVMMLVVAVALSTATYAWFTSNASVTASSLTMTAATNNAASIGISWSNGSFGTRISANSPASGVKFAPAAINSATAGAALASAVWSSATVREVAGNPTFNAASATTIAANNFTSVAAGDNSLAYMYNDGAEPTQSSTIYIKNGSNTNALSAVTCKATVTGEARDFIRIAIFRNDGAEGAFQLKGILTDRFTYTAAGTGTSVQGVVYYDEFGTVLATGDGSAAIPANAYTRSAAAGGFNVAVGLVEQDEQVSTTITTATVASLAVDCGSLAANTVMQLKIVVWMDGEALRDNTAGSTGKTAGVSLDFDATRA